MKIFRENIVPIKILILIFSFFLLLQMLIYFTSSPDFLAEVRSLRQRYDPTLPVVVHCSAGVGRSGVVVLMDMLMAKVDCGDVSAEVI